MDRGAWKINRLSCQILLERVNPKHETSIRWVVLCYPFNKPVMLGLSIISEDMFLDPTQT